MKQLVCRLKKSAVTCLLKNTSVQVLDRLRLNGLAEYYQLLVIVPAALFKKTELQRLKWPSGKSVCL